MHPTYLGWQVDWPLFVKQPFDAHGKNWKRGMHFPWAEMFIEEDRVASLYNAGILYHNKDFEVKNKVGDRLSELNKDQLRLLVTNLNAVVKSRTSSTSEYNTKKCKSSAIDDKQRGLIRRFLNLNPWIMDDFYELRDKILTE